MTSRAVWIDLKARTGQYQRAMKKAENATTGVRKSLGQIFTGAAKAGVVGAAVGVAAIGAASIKVGIDAAKAFGKFEQTMSRIVGLVGISKDVVDGFSDSIKDISVATARGSQELAEALFFITSAGLEGQEALDALEASARAAAAGLGDTATIADVVTSAVNAYGESMGGAAVATDVLVATVREGKAEAASLAGAMGRVIPIASQMGISFDQVGAAIAAMTRVGLDAAEASTALKGIMNSLLKPTTDASKALAEVGLSAKGLREEIREKGLFAALETITKAFEGQDAATVRVFGNVRALTGVLSLMGSNAGATKQIFDELASATGSLDAAFEAAADTGAFAFEQARVRIENALLEVGEEILPKLADALDDIIPLLPELIGHLGDLAIAMVDLGAKAIPVIVDGFAAAEIAILRFETGVLRMQRLGGTGLFGLFDGWDEVKATQLAWLEVQQRVTLALNAGWEATAAAEHGIVGLVDANILNVESLAMVQRQAGLTDVEMVALIGDGDRLAATWGFTAEQSAILAFVIAGMATEMKFAGSSIGGTSEKLSLFESSLGTAGSAARDAGPEVESMVLPLHLVRDALQEAEAANRSLADAMLEMVNPTFKAVKAVQKLDKAEEDLEKVRKAAGKRITVDEVEAIARAELAVVEATLQAQGALDALDFDPANLEASLQSIELVLGVSRDEAILLLETLGILDGMQVKALLEIETRITGPLAGAIGRAGLSDFELSLGRKEHGGPVAAGRPYIVGERGRELFIPDRAGTIIPNNILNQNRTSTKTINLTVNGTDTPVEDGESLLLLATLAGG